MQNETFLNICFNMENLTELERAAIIFYVFGGCKDRKILFQIAEGENRVNRLNENSLKTICNTWFNSHKIQSGIKYFSTLKQDHENEIINKYIEGLETETTNQDEKQKNNLKTNFLDRDEFLQFLNDKANTIQDDKLRNDILKMLSDNLRYKDSDTDEISEIQRFYTPITCENCVIYQRCKGCNISNCPKML